MVMTRWWTSRHGGWCQLVPNTARPTALTASYRVINPIGVSMASPAGLLQRNDVVLAPFHNSREMVGPQPQRGDSLPQVQSFVVDAGDTALAASLARYVIQDRFDDVRQNVQPAVHD